MSAARRPALRLAGCLDGRATAASDHLDQHDSIVLAGKGLLRGICATCSTVRIAHFLIRLGRGKFAPPWSITASLPKSTT